MDQRRSRAGVDLVDEAMEALNARTGEYLLRPFVRTAGDEMQAVLGGGRAMPEIAMYCLRAGRWWFGIGVGAIERPLGRTARESRGPAFYAARDALDLARSKRQHRQSRPFAVAAHGERVKEDMEAALYALAFVLEGRTERQWQAMDLADESSSGPALAAKLDIAPQSANRMLRTAGAEEERRLRGLLSRLTEDVIT